MKKYLLIGVLLFVTFASKAQVSTDLFNIQTDGTIKVNNSSYLEPFYWESSYKLLPYKTYKIQSPDRKCQYDVILEYLGDNYYDFNFNSLKIIYNNQNICQVKNSNMWGPGNQVAAIPISSENAAFEQIPLSSTAFALILFGYAYEELPLLTIIVVNEDKATLVFNKRCEVLKYTHTNETFSLIYTDQMQEALDINSQPEPADDELAKFKIWKSGNVLKYQRIQ